jgi:hypothetical protein
LQHGKDRVVKSLAAKTWPSIASRTAYGLADVSWTDGERAAGHKLSGKLQ